MKLPLLALLALAPTLAPAQTTDIFTTAARNGSFDTLVSLVAAADLDEVLEGRGSFTVFAPTDEAFAKLPAAALESLRGPDGRAQLAEILRYHVLGQRVSIPVDPPSHRLTQAKTLQGARVEFERNGTAVLVDGAKVLTRNIDCTNGYIHSIDTVLMPPASDPGVAELLQADGRFSTLLAALAAGDLTEAIATGKDLTVFATTDDAFAALPAGTLDTLLDPANRPSLVAILEDHVLGQQRSARDLVGDEDTKPLSGRPLAVAIRDGQLEIDGVLVVQNDLAASNGVVHVLAGVILPKTANTPMRGASERGMSERTGTVEIRATWNESVVRDGVRAGRIVVRCSGGGSVSLTNVDADEIETNIGGGSSVSLSGRAARHTALVSGGARLAARDLSTQSSDLVVNGGGDATVNATDALKFKVNSGATLRYVETRARIERDVARYATVEVLRD